MANFEAKQKGVARRYGKVLFELAQEGQVLEEVLKDTRLLRQYIQEVPLEWSCVINPSISSQIQQRIIESLTPVLKLGSLMTRFLMVLCQNHRLQNLNSILEELLVQSQIAAGTVEGVLKTTVALSKKEIAALQKSLKQHLGKEITLRQEIQESLLGGLVLQIGFLMMDASIASQLKKLRQAMKG